MPYQIVDANSAQQFDETAEKYSQILQSYEWGKVKSGFGWQPLMMINGASCSLMLKRKLPLINKCFFYIPRGPLIDFNDNKAVDEFISAVKAEGKKHGALFLRIDPEADENNASVLSLLKEQGFIKAKKQVQPRSTYILDLTKDENEIVKGFEPKFRYNIKVAEKHGVTVKDRDDEAAIDEFYDIYKVTSSRQTFIIHPLSYYKKIYEVLIKKGMGRVFTAYSGEVPIASVIVFIFGKRVWYMYGASSNEYRNIMPNNLIHMNVIKWARNMGAEEYDLWGIPSNPKEGHPLWGVYRFKKGFGAQLHKFIGAYDLPFNRPLYFVFDYLIIMYQNLSRLIRKGSMSDSLGE